MTEFSKCSCGKTKVPVFVGDALFDEVCLGCYQLALVKRK